MSVATASALSTNEAKLSAIKGAVIGIGVGALLACLSIAFLVWRRRHRLERRRFETLFGPTPFLVRPPPPVNKPSPRVARPARRTEARTAGIVRFSDAIKNSVDPPRAPRATAAPKRTAKDFKGNWGRNIDVKATRAVPPAHISSRV